MSHKPIPHEGSIQGEVKNCWYVTHKHQNISCGASHVFIVLFTWNLNQLIYS